jgi:hypothetical protein
MSENSLNNRKSRKGKEILERLKKPICRIRDFLSRRYVWLSLTVGFLWILSIPFILTLFQGFLGDTIEQFNWIFQTFYFPLTLSIYLLVDIVPTEMWIVFYGFAFVISMPVCLCIAYVIHRVCSSEYEQKGIRIENE